MKNIVQIHSVGREVVRWASLTAGFFFVMFMLYTNVIETSAAVTNNGIFFYGDTSATTQGALRGKTFTSPATQGTEYNGATASSTSIIVWTTGRAAPTREEMMIGTLKVNGTLDIQTCTTGCDANADFTARWNNAGTTATQDCDSSPTASTCVRTFDIGYESLSGHGFVAYGDNSADTFYYARWSGSAWAPNATPGTPGVSNAVSLPGTAGVPEWIRVIPSGDNLADGRSNRVMVLVSDKNDDLFAFYWNGTSFDSGTTIETALENCSIGQCFDGNWQGTDTFVLSYVDADGVNDVKYQRYTVSGGWGAETQAYTTNSAGQWLVSTADPTSSRILVASSANGNDTRSGVWRGDDATDGWTVGCADTSTEDVSGMQAFTAFERFNGQGLHVFNDAGNNAGSLSDYCTYTPTSTWGAVTGTGITNADDNMQIKAWGSPNSDDIMIIAQDVDCDTDAKLWTGAGLGAQISDIELDNSSYGLACPNQNSPGTPPAGSAQSVEFVWKLYSPWQRNWRFYNITDTASTPTTDLAAENTTPTAAILPTSGSFRLRINYAERGTLSATDSRRKLQFTSGCNPNSALETTCTWTDVDDISGSGIWRYRDLACTATDCADGTTLVGTVLTGSSACTAGNGCGTWVMDKDAAAATTMDHNGSQVQESEWIVEANGAAETTTYYFRIWDVEQETPVYREQDSSDCGGGAAACTYPFLTTDVNPGPTMDQVMRHGNWFSNAGVEQSLFWAN
jgi:hypothetical protein